MLVHELTTEHYPIITEAGLKIDNPGGKWLQNKREYAKIMMRNEFGKPHTGTVTGYFTEPIQLPVSLLKTFPGVRGEQSRVRSDTLDWLVDYMGKNNKLPPGPTKEEPHEYAPFIQVAYNGEPWVSEGNHRIMAAAKLGWKSMPIELRYFDGGEEVDGPLHPSKL